ncbi:MAG: DNA primase [Frankiales bacterium]|nr:DNA primase [Frankiales bacterium]
MAGRIRDEDVALVREKARIDEVIRDYVTLKSAGGGSLKGLCPFHDERSPSFNVNPAKGAWYCFGCGEGGDVIGFLRKIDHLSFTETVEKLAGRYGVTLRYADGPAAPSRSAGNRRRLVEAHKEAAAFYVEQLAGPEAEAGRRFLTERGFDAEAAAHFGVGYAPKGWDNLLTHLRRKGFSDDVLAEGGLVARGGQRGIYDRFRGRLVWPIRDTSGDVVGFGARKLYDEDDGPKYLNTPETPLYKKSQVLYGIDLARREIARRKQAVIVEGYTDVMAAHLSGVETAVATCGTAFGSDHIAVLRRLLMDDGVFTGEVVFTFDGDAAGQKAAQRAFGEDQRFTAQTFVAVEPGGMDPCELRMAQGPDAVRSLVEHKVPLFEFAIRTELAGHDLDHAEGRVAALRAAAPVVARIRDEALRPEYVRRLSGWLGMPDDEVRRAVQAAGRAQPAPARRPAPATGEPVGPPPVPRLARPDPRDKVAAIEREALKVALQAPELGGTWIDALETEAFRTPAYAAVHAAVVDAGGAASGLVDRAWLDAVLAACPDDAVRAVVHELAVDPIPMVEVDQRYAQSVVARLLEIDAARRITDLKARLERVEPTSDPDAYQAVFAEVLALEKVRRELREQVAGGPSA